MTTIRKKQSFFDVGAFQISLAWKKIDYLEVVIAESSTLKMSETAYYYVVLGDVLNNQPAMTAGETCPKNSVVNGKSTNSSQGDRSTVIESKCTRKKSNNYKNKGALFGGQKVFLAR